MSPRPDLQALQATAAEHTAAHPHTLAVLLEYRMGLQISGARAKSCSRRPPNAAGSEGCGADPIKMSVGQQF